jgi:ligand-binding SRPBCC domain-containing protein
MGSEGEVVVSSTLDAPAAAVWSRAVTVSGVNHELGPWLQMTVPRRYRGAADDLNIDDVPLGEVLGRSWVKLFGLIPVDYDDLRLVEREPGRRFQEDSQLLSLARWRHERVVERVGEGTCTVTDRLQFRPRRPLAWIPGSNRLVEAIVRAIFNHRHRRLKAYFGS